MATQEDLWRQHWAEVKDFVLTHRRLPSKHRAEDHKMLNWLKYNRKLVNKGKLPPERLKLFEELRQLSARYRRINLTTYVIPFDDDDDGQLDLPLDDGQLDLPLDGDGSVPRNPLA